MDLADAALGHAEDVADLAQREVLDVEQDGDLARIAVAAGERWDDFVRWTLGQGFAGLENLILIPGTVGAAPIQNIGAYGTEVAEFIQSVEAWDLHQRRVVSLDNAACAFAYRHSLFKREPGRYIVTFSSPNLGCAVLPAVSHNGTDVVAGSASASSQAK